MNPENVRSHQINEWLWLDANGNPHVDIPAAFDPTPLNMSTEEITPAQLAQLAATLMQMAISEKDAIARAYRLYLTCQLYLEERKPKAKGQ